MSTARRTGIHAWLLALVGAALVAGLLGWLLLVGRSAGPPARHPADRIYDARLSGILPLGTPGPRPPPAGGLASPAPSPSPAVAAPAAPTGQPTPTPLPEAFQSLIWPRPVAQVADSAAATVARQLEPFPTLARFHDRARRAAGRVAALSPFEYLVWVTYDRRPELRDELLALYHRDPPAALRHSSQIGLWPSPQADLLLDSPAQFDVDDDRILLNMGATEPEAGLTVLVHELWHATPDIRYWQGSDGTRFLTTGFWTERLDPMAGIWLPVEGPRPLVFAPWLLDEAMAYRQEWDGVGAEPPTHEPIRQAAAFLDRVERLIGRERLLTLYLTSDPDGFLAAVREHRTELAEFFAPGA